MSRKLSSGSDLYLSSEQCCGCGACVEVCPSDAITLKEDQLGFLVASVDIDRCVGCELCIDNCAYGKSEMSNPEKCYAGVNRQRDMLLNSTSGGAFSALAKAFLRSGGVVCGVNMTITHNTADVRHIVIEKEADIPLLQGSKYVQSDVSKCYAALREHLSMGKRVLFSGTPCQVAAVKKVFSRYEGQLFTIDLVCHGVPSAAVFNSYLEFVAEREGKDIVSINFRDKKFGWEALKGVAVLRNSEGEESEKVFHTRDSSYYRFFMKDDVLRDSCYSCPYARVERVGDVTLGDFWGIQTNAPRLLMENGGSLDPHTGISCILQNTSRGAQLLELSEAELKVFPVRYEQIVQENTRLICSPKRTERRQLLLDALASDGYAQMDKMHQQWRAEERKKYCDKHGTDLDDLMPNDTIL